MWDVEADAEDDEVQNSGFGFTWKRLDRSQGFYSLYVVVLNEYAIVNKPLFIVTQLPTKHRGF